MMYCPYAVNRHLVQQTTYEYNDDNYQTLQQTIEHNTAEFVERNRSENPNSCFNQKGIMRRMARWEVPL